MRPKHQFCFLAVLALTQCLCGAQFARASVICTYTYTGNDFEFATPPYTTSDRITGSITLANPLGDNLNGASVAPSAFSFFDGVQTVSSSNFSGDAFQFWTDGTGSITQWLTLVWGPDPNDSIQSANTTGDVEDIGFIHSTSGIRNSDPGSWAVTPLPATLPLFASGLGALGLLGWRQRRKTARAN